MEELKVLELAFRELVAETEERLEEATRLFIERLKAEHGELLRAVSRYRDTVFISELERRFPCASVDGTIRLRDGQLRSIAGVTINANIPEFLCLRPWEVARTIRGLRELTTERMLEIYEERSRESLEQLRHLVESLDEVSSLLKEQIARVAVKEA